MNNIKIINYSFWIDWFLNSWEFCEDSQIESKEIVESLNPELDQQIKDILAVKVCQMMNYWIHNEDNLRISIELNYHKNVEEYEEQMKDLVRKFLLTP